MVETMVETKASRLQLLSDIVTVPEFVVFDRDDEHHFEPDSSCRYLVRSSSKLEDQHDFSQAGQFTTIGPITNKEVVAAIQQLFNNSDVDEVIVQEFIDAELWGVAFCFSKNNILLEYSGVFEGVTSGSVNPFTAILPSACSGYKNLEKELVKIVSRFGPCDVEFVNIQNPQFVQVRPITREIKFDENFVKLKMQLQELHGCAWIENDVCRILSERDHKSQAIRELYLQALKDVYATYLKRNIDIPQQAFIKISEQYFMDRQLEKQIMPGFFELLRLGFQMSKILNKIKKQDFSQLSAIELMQNSILLSFAYELFKKKETMALREMLRIELEQKIPEGTIAADYYNKKILANSIEFDRDRYLWKSIAFRDEQGIVVVAGELEKGPYYRFTKKNQEIPSGVIVVTEHLYPEIGHSINTIKGIICKHGALGAHVAILAREYQVPLRIQTSIEKYE